MLVGSKEYRNLSNKEKELLGNCSIGLNVTIKVKQFAKLAEEKNASKKVRELLDKEYFGK